MRAFTCRVVAGQITFFQGLPSATRLACSSRHTLFGEKAPLGPFLIASTLETPVLVRRRTRSSGVCASLQGLHLADHRRIHSARLRPLFVERRVAPLEHCFTIFCQPVHSVLAAQIRDRHTAVGLAQDRKNLGRAISRHLQQNLLTYLAEKILLPHPLSFGGITK